MKKTLLVLSVMATILSGCYMEPMRDHQGGAYDGGHEGDNERGHHEENDRHDRERE